MTTGRRLRYSESLRAAKWRRYRTASSRRLIQRNQPSSPLCSRGATRPSCAEPTTPRVMPSWKFTACSEHNLSGVVLLIQGGAEGVTAEEHKAERIVAEAMKRLGWTKVELVRRKNGM